MFSQSYLCTVQIFAPNFIGYVSLYKLYIKLLAPIVVYKQKYLLTLINDETRVMTKDVRVDIFR